MEKQMVLLSLNDTCRDKSKKNRKSSIPTLSSDNVLVETGAFIAKMIGDLETYYRKLIKEQKDLNTGNALAEEFARNNLKISEIKSQLNAMHELNKIYLSDMKKIEQMINRQRKKNENKFMKRMAYFQRFKEILSLMQNSEIREAFRTKTKRAIKLTEDEFAHLDWLNAAINPSINSVQNRKAWHRKLRDSTFKGIELIIGSNKKINNSWTGQDTKRLLERISNCGFFEGEPVWTNMEIFNRFNKSTSPAKTISGTEMKSNLSMTSNANISKCHNQGFNNSSIKADKKVTKKTKTNKREMYAYRKMSDKPNDYYLRFNFYPARFTADIKVPPSLGGQPPGIIIRCDF